MNKYKGLVCCAAWLLSCMPGFAIKLYDAEVVRAIIHESIRNFPERCACPYSTRVNGVPCGQSSAYKKALEYGALCYPKDVTLQMVRVYRASH